MPRTQPALPGPRARACKTQAADQPPFSDEPGCSVLRLGSRAEKSSLSRKNEGSPQAIANARQAMRPVISRSTPAATSLVGEIQPGAGGDIELAGEQTCR